MMINSNSHKQYFQQFNSRYIVPQHKNPRNIKFKNKSDRKWTQSKLEIQENRLILTRILTQKYAQ